MVTGTAKHTELGRDAVAESSIALFDGIGTAHSLPLVAGLDAAAAAAGIRRQWTTALRPPGAGSEACKWTRIDGFYARYCETGTFRASAYRQAWREAVTRAEQFGASFYCDLAVEQLLSSRLGRVELGIPGVWVVHQVPAPPRAGSHWHRGKALVANRRRWKIEARLARSRSVLRNLARGDGRFVVHTAAARERLARIVPASPIHLAPWPIVSAAAPPELACGSGAVTAVFPGECRAGKGLDVLLDALPSVSGLDQVDLPTVVTADAQHLVRSAADPRVRISTSWLTNDEYHARLRAASLAVLPYRTSAMANAGISASLLDVLAVGLPAVITKPIARGLPPRYEGAIVVDADSPAALADGINRALTQLDELRVAAQQQGPSFVVANHSYERYLATLIEAGTAS
ncbi:MAG TPA: glycosyltransferase [Acidimicrobiia bacterium]|jgi:hypothetical protein|nr:glycosyltransferase [Acidimicrobiia bacterium]